MKSHRVENTYRTGKIFEKLSMWYLLLKGYRFVARNLKVGRGTGAGEIDLIVKKGDLLVFVEVKHRPSFCQAAESITLKNQIRIVRSSGAFLKKNPIYRKCQVRYDALLWQKGKNFPKHIQNAWRVF